MNLYKTYIFDLDGTITNTMSLWLDVIREALKNFGIIVQDDKTLSRYTHDWSTLLDLGLPKKNLKLFTKKVYEIINVQLSNAPFHTGAYETLEQLKNQGKRLAIFSSMNRPLFEIATSQRNLDFMVDTAIAGTDVKYRKPHPAGIFKALDDMKIPKREYKWAVYVGDKDTDIQAAQNAGINSILYYPIEHQLMYDLKEIKTHNPTHVITNWEQLLEL